MCFNVLFMNYRDKFGILTQNFSEWVNRENFGVYLELFDGKLEGSGVNRGGTLTPKLKFGW